MARVGTVVKCIFHQYPRKGRLVFSGAKNTYRETSRFEHKINKILCKPQLLFDDNNLPIEKQAPLDSTNIPAKIGEITEKISSENENAIDIVFEKIVTVDSSEKTKTKDISNK